MFKKMLKRSPKSKPLPARITNDLMAQHREDVAGGRKHKYPVIYTKRRLVWITLAVSATGLLLISICSSGSNCIFAKILAISRIE